MSMVMPRAFSSGRRSQSMPVSALISAEGFCDWVHRLETVDRWLYLMRGVVIELPRLQNPNGAICMIIVHFLTAYVRQRRRGYITCNDSGVILERDPDTVRGPDVAL